MTEKISLVLADDHPLTCVSIRTLVNDEVDLILLGEAAHFDEAQRLCQERQPDVLLLAANLIAPALGEQLSSLRDSCPATSVLLLTTGCGCLDWCELAAPGAAGCILKEDIPDSLVLAIRSVAQGNFWFSQAIGQELWPPPDGQEPLSAEDVHLTARELEVLQLIASGSSNRMIAGELGITKRTASFHVSNVLRKLGVPSRVEAAIWAKEHGAA